MRGHQPIVIEEFNGLWKRGDDDSCPPDHFPDCNNIQFIQGGFKSRDVIDKYLIDGIETTIGNIKRIYTYVQQETEGLLILDDNGNIYHSKSPTPLVPILHVDGMTDFAFVARSGYAFISPHDGNTGLDGEFLYVYLGEGDPARKAAGDIPSSAPSAANSATAGDVETGYHMFSVVYETDTGYLTGFDHDCTVALNATGAKKATLTSIPVSPSTAVVARRIVATKAIDPTFFVGDIMGYQFFFVPDGRIADNTTTTIDLSFFDSELLEDASYLRDNFTEIPAGAHLSLYHDRLVLCAPPPDTEIHHPGDKVVDRRSVALVSFTGEPEAISEVDGLIIAPLDGKPLCCGQEFRDVLYLFKQIRTFGVTDNGDIPSSWPVTVIDEGIGAPIHGIATVMDSGGVNIESLVVADYDGLMVFTGTFQKPELSYKIKDYWLDLDRDNFNKVQLVNDTLKQLIYMVLPSGGMLLIDYGNGMDAKSIRFAPWTFAVSVSAVCLIDVNTLIIGTFEE